MKIFNLRHSIIGIIISLFFFNSLHSQWVNKWVQVPINDNGIPGMYLDVFFLNDNPDFGWACGYNSKIIRTTDGGRNWSFTQLSIRTLQLESIHFVNERIGYTSGPNNALDSDGSSLPGRIFKTTNGGQTWFDVSPQSENVQLWGNYFVDENFGFVIGGGCNRFPQTFYKTTNGGQSWSVKRYFDFETGKLSDLIMDGETGIGYAIGSGALWRSTNFGDDWEVISRTGRVDWHEEITLIGESLLIPYSEGCEGTGINIRGSGGARFTTNLGESWNTTSFGENREMFGTFLINETTGWAAGLNTSMYYTCDAGQNWEKIDCGLFGNLDDIHFINDTTGWVVGDYIFRTARLDEREVISLNDTIYVCYGEEYELKPDLEFTSYRWSNCLTDDALLVSNEGEYKLYAYNDPCSETYIYTFTVIEYPQKSYEIQANQNTTLCEGDSLVLSFEDDFLSAEWSTGENTKSIIVKETGTYYLTTIDSNGCSNTDSIFVEFNPPPKSEIIASGKINFCLGDSVILSSKFDEERYIWRDKNYNIISEENSLIVRNEGQYTLEVINKYGCSDLSTPLNIIVRPDTNLLEFSYSNENEFIFDNITLTEKICQEIEVNNISTNASYYLDNAFIENKFYFSYPRSQTPIIIPPNSSIEFTVCFDPDSVGLFRDAILFSDTCTDHRIPLRGLADAFELNGITRCELPWSGESVRITGKYFLEHSFPYPIPASNEVSLEFVSFIPIEKSINDLEVSLYNSFGEKIGDFDILQNEITKSKDGELVHGIFNLKNINLLSNGLYLISVQNKKDIEKVIPIIIQK